MNDDLKYNETASNLRNQILSRQLSGKLPGERELARIYKTSRITIRKALDILIDEHLIYRLKRKGAFVGRAPESVENSRNRRVGFILFGKRYMSRFESIVFTEFAKRCSNAGIKIIFNHMEDMRHFQENFRELARSEQFDLIIFCGTPLPAAATMANQMNIPIILLGGLTSKEPEENYDRIAISYYQWGYRATRFLIAHGKHRIAIISPDNAIIKSEMIQGYRAALEEDGVTFRDSLVSDCPDNSAMAAMNQALSMMEFNQPEAIIAGSDAISAGVIPVVLQTLEEEIRVVAYCSEPELTTKIFPVEQLRINTSDAASKLWELTRRRLKHPSAKPKSYRPLISFE